MARMYARHDRMNGWYNEKRADAKALIETPIENIAIIKELITTWSEPLLKPANTVTAQHPVVVFDLRVECTLSSWKH